jgi:hypothetical protein
MVLWLGSPTNGDTLAVGATWANRVFEESGGLRLDLLRSDNAESGAVPPFGAIAKWSDRHL